MQVALWILLKKVKCETVIMTHCRRKGCYCHVSDRRARLEKGAIESLSGDVSEGEQRAEPESVRAQTEIEQTKAVLMLGNMFIYSKCGKVQFSGRRYGMP